MRAFVGVCAALLTFMCAGPIIEWGAHNLAWIGAVTFFLVCVLFAVLGPVGEWMETR